MFNLTPRVQVIDLRGFLQLSGLFTDGGFLVWISVGVVLAMVGSPVWTSGPNPSPTQSTKGSYALGEHKDDAMLSSVPPSFQQLVRMHKRG